LRIYFAPALCYNLKQTGHIVIKLNRVRDYT